MPVIPVIPVFVCTVLRPPLPRKMGVLICIRAMSPFANLLWQPLVKDRFLATVAATVVAIAKAIGIHTLHKVLTTMECVDDSRTRNRVTTAYTGGARV